MSAIIPPRVKQKAKRGAADWDYRGKYEKEIKFYNDNKYVSVIQGPGGHLSNLDRA